MWVWQYEGFQWCRVVIHGDKVIIRPPNCQIGVVDKTYMILYYATENINVIILLIKLRHVSDLTLKEYECELKW